MVDHFGVACCRSGLGNKAALSKVCVFSKFQPRRRKVLHKKTIDLQINETAKAIRNEKKDEGRSKKGQNSVLEGSV